MNQFDSANFPEREPTELVIGDRWMWKRTDLGLDYPPASYSLKYSLRLESSLATEIEIPATGSGGDFVVEVAAAATAAYTAGRYRWQAYITRTSDTQRVTIATGNVEVIPNRDLATTDPRTHARKCLDSINAALEAFAADTVQNYSITTGAGNRTVTKRNTKELLELRDYYVALVTAEERKENNRGGSKLVVSL